MKLIVRVSLIHWVWMGLSSCAVLFASGSAQASEKVPSCDPLVFSSHLPQKIEKILAQPQLARTRWGLDIRQMPGRASDVQARHAKNAEQMFLPASTAKIFTSVALVSDFDGRYQIQTPYLAAGGAPDLQALRVKGVGDPTILDPQLLALAQTLKSQGVKTIDSLVGDNRVFGGPTIVSSWEWVDLQTSDGVPITSLSFSQNSLPLRLSPTQLNQPLRTEWLDGEIQPRLPFHNLSQTVSKDAPEYIALERPLSGDRITIRGQLREGASPDTSYVAIANPTSYFLYRLKSALETQGITVNNLVSMDADTPQSVVPSLDSEQQMGSIASSPLSELLKEVNQSSNNFYTESLLRHWAWRQSSDNQSDTSVTLTQSLKLLEQTLKPLGVDPNAYQLKDASGLSRQNLVSPKSLTSVLMAALNWQQSEPSKFKLFKESLAIAGEAGTLKRRFQDTPVAGKLFAKTGTLSGTVTLAGFLYEPGHPTIVFSIMANNSDQSVATLRRAIDDIVLKLQEAQSCR